MNDYFITEYNIELRQFIWNRLTNTYHHPDKTFCDQIIQICTTLREPDCVTTTRINIVNDARLLMQIMFDYNSNHIELVKIMFYNKSFRHIRAVLREFEMLSLHANLENLLDSVFNQKSFIYKNIVSYVKSPARYFAQLLEKSMKGLGTDIKLLICVILMRCEVDMVDIKREFEILTQKGTLREWISDEHLNKTLKSALYKLIGEDET